MFQKEKESLIELAEDNLNQLLNIINDKKINKKYLKIFQNIYKSNKICMDMCKGNYEICIEQFKEYYPKIQALRDKNFYKFVIGYCYYMSNNKLQSKEYFEYVVNNGPKLYIAKQAREYLEEMA